MTLMCKKQHLHNEEEFYHAVKKQNILLFITSEVLLCFEAPSQSRFQQRPVQEPLLEG